MTLDPVRGAYRRFTGATAAFALQPTTQVPILESVRPAFRALAETIVPQAVDLDAAGWAEVEVIVEDALAARPPAMQRQLLVFIRALMVLPVLRWGRGFRRLEPARRARFLAAIQGSPLFLLRRGFWGLRTLVYMGYYGREAGYRAVGYDARLRGWLEHPAAPEAARRASERARRAADNAGEQGRPQ